MARARRTSWACGLTLALAACGSSPTADRDCGDFANQREAQAWLDDHAGDPDGLDADGNGVACESMQAARAVPSGPRRVRVTARRRRRHDQGRRAARPCASSGSTRPESKRPQTPVECGAKRAAAALAHLLAGKQVTLRRDPTQDAFDRYGRTLAYVDVGSRDAGEQMVRTGWAKPYVYQGVPFERLAAYERAEDAARASRSGVHGACASDFHRAADANCGRSSPGRSSRERGSRSPRS